MSQKMPEKWSSHEREVGQEYKETLETLTFNSKPVISTLTELAYENRADAPNNSTKVLAESRSGNLAGDQPPAALYRTVSNRMILPRVESRSL